MKQLTKNNHFLKIHFEHVQMANILLLPILRVHDRRKQCTHFPELICNWARARETVLRRSRSWRLIYMMWSTLHKHIVLLLNLTVIFEDHMMFVISCYIWFVTRICIPLFNSDKTYILNYQSCLSDLLIWLKSDYCTIAWHFQSPPTTTTTKTETHAILLWWLLSHRDHRDKNSILLLIINHWICLLVLPYARIHFKRNHCVKIQININTK